MPNAKTVTKVTFTFSDNTTSDFQVPQDDCAIFWGNDGADMLIEYYMRCCMDPKKARGRIQKIESAIAGGTSVFSKNPTCDIAPLG